MLKRLLGLALITFVLSFLLIGSIVMAYQIPETYTDQIRTLGTVKRVYFYCRVISGTVSEWHYFGTNPSQNPPTTNDPVFEHAYVQFPTAFQDIQNAEDEYYKMGLDAIANREGLSYTGIRQMFTDGYEDLGVVINVSFRFQTYDLVWHYVGSTLAEYPTEGVVFEYPVVQFPRDLDELTESDDSLYSLALEAGLRREGIK